MKKLFWVLLAVLMLCAASAAAESTLPEIHISGRFAYRLRDDGNAYIFRYLGDPGDGVFPPHEIDGYPASHDRDIGIGEYSPYFINDNTLPFLYSLLEDGTAEICCYLGDPSQIPDVPETIDGFRVSRVNPYYEQGLKTSGMFEYFIRSDGTAEIYNLQIDELLAFRDSGKLLEIPEQLDGYPVTVLRFKALRGDLFRASAFRISIPRTVTAIRSGTLPYANTFSEILVDKANPVYTVKDDMLINRKENSVVCYAGRSTRTHIQIPDGIEEIHNNAFNIAYNAVSVTIPDSVKRIGEDAFSFVEQTFKQLVIPATIEYMGIRAFRYVIGETLIITKGQRNDLIHSLKELFGGHDRYASNDAFLSEPVSVYDQRPVDWGFVNNFDHVQIDADIDADNEYLAYVNGCLYSKWNKELLRYCPQSEAETGTFVIPEGTASIGSGAFAGSMFTGFVLPDSISEIDDGDFYGCWGLTSFVVPEGVTAIGAQVFAECVNLTSISLPDSVIIIDAEAFRGCDALESIILPESLTHIGAGAFDGCVNLKNITIPDSVISIDDQAFRNCQSLTSITLPKGLCSYGEGAYKGRTFDRCSALTSVIVPEGVTVICREMFTRCESLTNVTLSDGLLIIEENAFKGCKNLAAVNIPASVTEIEKGAFEKKCTATFTVVPGTYGETWCQENGFNYVYAD